MQIRCHIVYDIKHDGRQRSRLVAGGHLTEPAIDIVYSGVVSFRGIRLVTFLPQLNKLELWGTDIGNDYLEATTKEELYIIGCAAFGALERYTLVVYKALYGLRPSGLCWHQQFVDVLRSLSFTPYKVENEIWMRPYNGVANTSLSMLMTYSLRQKNFYLSLRHWRSNINSNT
jgi:Reverse transcriptase (RNA-dependent DNA polymerase)